jgi:hypothetical protein
MAIVKFEQDPDAQLGQGNFTNDQGRTIYTYDPETANTFIPTIPGKKIGGSSVAEQVMNESTHIATQTMGGSPAQQLVGKLASLEGATGSAATGVPDAPKPASPYGQQPAPMTPAASPAAPATPAQALVAKHDQATAPRSDGLVKVGSSSSRQVQQGRDAGNVQKQIDAETAAGTANDLALLGAAEATDKRNVGVVEERQRGVQSTAGRDVAQGFEAKRVQQEVQTQVAQLREELKQNDESFDPERLMKNMSTGKAVLMTVLAAISGAFGAVLGNKDNAFMSVIDRKVQQDLEKQKAEIASGRVRIGNHIAELMQRGYDAKTAEKLAADRLNSGVDRMIELQAQKQGLQGAQLEAAKQLVAQRAEARAARVGDLLAQTENRVVESSQTSYERPKPAGAVTLEDLKKQLEIQQLQLENLDAQEVAAAIGPDENGKPRRLSVKRAKEVVDNAGVVSRNIGRAEVAHQQFQNVLNAAGVPPAAYNPETGVIDWSQVPDLRGIGPIDSVSGKGGVGMPLTADSDPARVLNAARELRESITYMTTGAVADKVTQVPTFDSQAGADISNEEAWKETMQRTAQQIATFRASVKAADAEATRLYEHNFNRGETNTLQVR